ncbi:MAG: FliM/FliN family flagellar motor switch protein [Rhodothermales bacterium]|nr:FliM/FliN family flagellar motor switch protein [Rhodothermales bacterium]
MDPTPAPPPAAPARGRIQPYDFRQPRLLAQDQMRALGRVHESFARDFAVLLSTKLRTIVDLRLLAVEQVRFADYVQASPVPTTLYVMAAPALGERFLVELDPALAIFIVEKLFGGTGTAMPDARALSQVERGVMQKIVGRAMEELSRTWQPLYEGPFELVSYESNAELVQIMAGATPAFTVHFEARLYEHTARMTLCYSYLLLEQMLGRSGSAALNGSTKSVVAPAVRERYEASVREVAVAVSAELGRARLPLAAVAALEPGDVLLLDRKAEAPVTVRVNRQPAFAAQAGRSGRHRAVRIVDLLEPLNLQADEPS